MSATPQTTIPLYLRKYQVVVSVTNGNTQQNIIVTDSENEPRALRVTFDISQKAFQVYWYADITIYNLDQATTNLLLGQQLQNLNVSVSAGYKDGAYGVIWSGPVFQPLFEREESLDFKVTLHCLLGLFENARNYVSQTFAAQITQTQLVQQMADQAFTKIPIDKVSANLSPKKLPRGKIVFGNPGKYFTQIAEDNNMQWWLSQKGLTMGFPDEDISPVVPDYLTFSPPLLPKPNTAGWVPPTNANGVIIDTPVQTQYGVAFRALLNPNVQVQKPMLQVKIDNSQIRRQKLLIDPSSQGPAKLTLLDQDGIYVVGGVRFSGDTRGEAWYVDVEAYATTVAKLQLMQAIAAANLNGG